MAQANPELQVKLQELDQEFQDGEITSKGYQKRRTLLFSQYLSGEPSPPPAQAPAPGGLRIHNPDDTAHPAAGEGYRAASFSAQAQQPPPNIVQDTYDDGSNGYGGSYGAPPATTQLGMLQVRNPEYQSTAGHDQQYGAPAHGQYDARSSFDNSRSPTMRSANYAFRPEHDAQAYGGQPEMGAPTGGDEDPMQTRQSTLVDQSAFSDFAGQQKGDYGGPQRYSDAFSPSAAIAPPMLRASDLPPAHAVQHLAPLEPRDFTFAVYDPHDANVPMSKFDNLPAVLRHRARTIPKQAAYWVLDGRGREIASVTWAKLASRAEKVAQVIRDKSSLYRGDRVALVYRDVEVIDFAVALMGCFIAGVVAVPINDLRDYGHLNMVLTTTQAHLALTTDTNLKNFQRMITESKLNWPKGVEWWKTNEFGSHHARKKDEAPAVAVPDLAYIEFSKAPTGDVRGVVMSHRTIMHQMACLSAIIATVPAGQDTFHPGLRNQQGRPMVASSGEILISYLDPRASIGLIMGVLLAVYGGHTAVWMEAEALATPGLYAHLISRYKATLMLADYPRLKQVVFNYQADPMATRSFKKNLEPSFQALKLCLIDTLTVEPEFQEILADRWLRPLRNPRARELVAPLLCLPEHGGMVVSMRDWLGGEERMGCLLNTFSDPPPEDDEPAFEPVAPAPPTNGFSSLIGSSASKPKHKVERKELNEVLLDKESLKTNEVVVVAVGEEARKRADEPGTIRVGAFGYPIPDATLAIVDPETSLLCAPTAIGEIWVDSPSLSGGFWALPKHTETIFHARPYKFVEGEPNPMPVEPEFLRTGLLGTVIEGKVFVLGLYEDRLRQRVEWVEDGVENAEHRYFFVQHLIISIMRNTPKIYDASAFDVFINAEHLPIILLESAAASTAPAATGGQPRPLDTALLDSLSERCMEVLYTEHHLRVYCVLITAPDVLPRHWKNGRREIGNMLCRRDFDAGSLPCVHVKFGVERSVLNLPLGVDPLGGIWSAPSSAARATVLEGQDKQYSGVDYHEVVIDERTSTPLTSFSSIVDLLQWRVARQAEELAYCTVDARGREGKGITWKKFDLKVAAVATYLKNKCRLRAGDHAVLMYTHSEEFVWAVHACLCLGIVAIPMQPLDHNRLNEDAPAFLHLVGDFSVKAILVNSDVNDLLKMKTVAQHIKQSAQVLKVGLPPSYNTTKPSKQSMGCRDLGFTVHPTWAKPGAPALVWTYWTPDQRRTAVQLGHDTIMGICKVQKETCQMTSSRPVLGCVRSFSGIGFVHTALMGTFVGAATYLVSPVDFAASPLALFHALSRYKIKDTYATGQMLDHAMHAVQAKGFLLHELKNMMIATDGRPRLDVFQKVRHHFAGAGLDRTAINTIYSHVLNPMVASRSYMCIEPVELWLDRRALRRGLVYPVDRDAGSDPAAAGALLVQDSGMVPVCTQIAIVNPETCHLCHVGEYGEIWVQSEACVAAFYGSRDPFDAERFRGRTVDGDPHVRYVRTGDLGFLHNVTRPIGPNGQPVEMQVLFVLGAIGETFEVNGLSHFPVDIEYSVEKCHRNIVPSGCAVFQAGGLLVVLVEVHRKAYLASMVPVIVNTILNEHQLVADIVAFVAQGLFPRSRLGEKQRGKILASWVTRKMETLAQFGIRDPADAVTGGAPAPSVAGVPEGDRRSQRGGPGLQHGPSSLRHSASVAEHDAQDASEASATPTARGYAQSGQPYESSIVESPPLEEPPQSHQQNQSHQQHQQQQDVHELDSTPTGTHDGGGTGGYFPPDAYSQDFYPPVTTRGAYDPELTPQAHHHPVPQQQQAQQQPPQELESPPPPPPPAKDGPGRPSGRSYVPYQPGGPRSASASGAAGGRGPDERKAEEDWPQEALMHMRGAGF